MRRNDWMCNRCGSYMLKTADDIHLVCSNLRCKSKLRIAKQLMDLPRAFHWNYPKPRRNYLWILGEIGRWEYVPHKHKEALNRLPDPGHVVARVLNLRDERWVPRTLRPIYPNLPPNHESS